ncbi:hypothetical protein QQZ08_005459 [Neonectria magnoliae]|uniref:Nephrocystin 3-like N-terminal domain-containing protein n=1 Tax=Neonectria magnoliae TaxID=2732573 RepID=A0ABR1I539_9HYPO
MSSPDAGSRIVRAENKQGGTQPLHQGDGNQGVIAGNNGSQTIIRSQNVFNIPLSSMSQMTELIHGGEDASNQPPNAAAIIEWLMLQSKVDFRSHHASLVAQMVPGTGSWILGSTEFEAWSKGSSASQFLWMHGILGSGKTMLSSLIIDSLEKSSSEDDSTACIYVYFQEVQDHGPTFAEIFTSLLKHLLQQQTPGDVVEKLQSKYNEWRHRKVFPAPDEYLAMFHAQVARFTTVYLVVDALDNCQNSSRENTQQKMQSALRQMPTNVKVLVTSRSGWLDGWDLDLDQQFHLVPNREDVEKYIRTQVRSNGIIQQFVAEKVKSSFEDNVVDKIAKENRGIFLLTKLHMEYLAEQKTLGDIKIALSNLPDSIPSAFEASIQKIKRHGKPDTIAQHVLTWTALAIEPPNADQIRHSFAISYSKQMLDKDFLPAEATLTSECAGLATIDSRTKMIRLVHESVPKYLRHHGIIRQNADMEMAKMCLRYLLFEEPPQGVGRPLLNYAANHWITHFVRGEEYVDDEAQVLVMKFLKDSAKVRTAFQAMAGTDSLAWCGITGLHAAVYFNRRRWVEQLINEGVHVDDSCSDGRTALHWAANSGRGELVEVLIQHSANKDIRDRNGDTPLHVAVTRSTMNCKEVVRNLVKGNARLDIRGGKGFTPLMWAIRYGPSSVARILAENQVDVNAEDDQGWTPLRGAMLEGQGRIINILLKKGVDLNRPSSDGWTPLRHAVQKGNKLMVRRLLKKHADVNLRDTEDGYSPLRWAVLYKHTLIVQLLIEKGADVNDKAKDKSTPLIEAVKSGDKTTVWMLLENGAEPDVEDSVGWTALHHATEAHRNPAIWLLITNGASTTLRDMDGLSCLDLAVQKNDFSVVWLLCENGARADTANEKGITALHHALWLGHLDMVRFFLDTGINVDLKDHNGFAALHHAVARGHQGIVELLISRGANVNMQDGMGLTALGATVLTKNLPIMDVLLDHGASCDIRNNEGKTALHEAATRGFNEGVRRLVNKTTKLDLKDSKGGFAALYYAIWQGDKDTVGLLLKAGADMDVQDNAGRTPLMFAAQMEKEDAVAALLEEGAKTDVQDEGGWTAMQYAGSHDGIKSRIEGAARKRE